MPELPDLEVYLDALRARVLDGPLKAVRILSPFVLRSVDPPLDALQGLRIQRLRRLGKRIVMSFEGELHLVVHLMIAGRFQWKEPGKPPPGKIALAGFVFEHGTLWLTEASTKKRASLHLVRGDEAMTCLDPQGLEVLSADLDAFRHRLCLENRTLKRALTDPHIFAGIGNAYSDEILHAARISPTQTTHRLRDFEIARLYDATRSVLSEWTERLRAEVGEGFPSKVTAFRPGMAVHGRFGKPCPTCSQPVQRIVYAENEANYCATCQTDGRLLADRALSKLLGRDWPKTLDELEARRTHESDPNTEAP